MSYDFETRMLTAMSNSDREKMLYLAKRMGILIDKKLKLDYLEDIKQMVETLKEGGFDAGTSEFLITSFLCNILNDIVKKCKVRTDKPMSYVEKYMKGYRIPATKVFVEKFKECQQSVIEFAEKAKNSKPDDEVTQEEREIAMNGLFEALGGSLGVDSEFLKSHMGKELEAEMLLSDVKTEEEAS